MVDHESVQREGEQRAAFHIFSLALFRNPRFVLRTVQYIQSQTTLPGFRPKPRPRCLTGTTSTGMGPPGRNMVFGGLSAETMTTESLDDAMRLVSTNIIQYSLQMHRSAVQMNVDLTLFSLMRRAMCGDDKAWHLQVARLKPDQPLVLPEIAIFVIEALVPRIDVRILFLHTAPATVNSNGNAWIRWWDHSFLGVPQRLLEGDPLFRVALQHMREHATGIFAQAATRPHSGVNTPIYYHHGKYGAIANRLYDGWYWVLTYLMQLGRATLYRAEIRSNNDTEVANFEKFMAFRRWFMETLSVIVFVATRDIAFMRRGAIELAEVSVSSPSDDHHHNTLDFGNIYDASGLFKALHGQKAWIRMRRQDGGVSETTSGSLVAHEAVALFRSWKSGKMATFWKTRIVDPLIRAHYEYTQNKVVNRFFD